MDAPTGNLVHRFQLLEIEAPSLSQSDHRTAEQLCTTRILTNCQSQGWGQKELGWRSPGDLWGQSGAPGYIWTTRSACAAGQERRRVILVFLPDTHFDLKHKNTAPHDVVQGHIWMRTSHFPLKFPYITLKYHRQCRTSVCTALQTEKSQRGSTTAHAVLGHHAVLGWPLQGSGSL